jgi:crotonobetainyl-CoA:carnitine CoA-transferase CaiB-like acyl-CoA transferase
MTALPLENVRVLDVSSILAAPVTATFLGDFGADVVKVEDPKFGDFTRGRAAEPGGRSTQWLQEGRNKRSITLNLRKAAGQEILKRLIPKFDVVVTNYRPPTLAKWGIDPDSMKKLSPRGILVFITGYGLTGPYSDRGSFDRVASSFAGLTYASGEPAGHPVRCGYAVLDYMSAYLAAFSVVTALYHRDVRGSGEGQVIDLALYEAGVRASEDAVVDYSVSRTVRERQGNRSYHVVPASDFSTADQRRVSMHAATDTLFKRLAQVMQRADLLTDERFNSRAARAQNQDDLYPIIEQWAAQHTGQELVDLLSEADIPASLVMNVADLCADPHVWQRGTLMKVKDDEFGEVTMVAPLPKMSATPGTVRWLGPALGEHNEQIYGELLGLAPSELADLKDEGII